MQHSCVYLGQPRLALFRWDGWQCASVGDGKRRQSGYREGHLWSWYYHVELGQLCRVMRDVPSDERLCYMLHVVLERVEVSHENKAVVFIFLTTYFS